MKNLELEKKIEEAAKINFNSLGGSDSDDYSYDHVIDAFCNGVKSEIAKEYWLQKLSEEFESESDNDYVSTIEIINKVLKSDMAKNYWQKGMYTENDLKNAFDAGQVSQCTADEWFKQNKK